MANKSPYWINPIRASTWLRRNAFFWMSIPASARLALRLVNAYKIRVLGFSVSVLCFEIGFRSPPVSSPRAGQSMVYWIHFLIVRFVSLLILSPKTDDDGAELRAGSPSKTTLGPARWLLDATFLSAGETLLLNQHHQSRDEAFETNVYETCTHIHTRVSSFRVDFNFISYILVGIWWARIGSKLANNAFVRSFDHIRKVTFCVA